MGDSQSAASQRALRLPFNLVVNFGGLAGHYSGFAVNLSSSGMLVATCQPPPLGVRFAAEFDLDAGRTVRAPVEVVWSQYVTEPDESGQRVAEVGLRFLSLMPSDREALERVAASRPKTVG